MKHLKKFENVSSELKANPKWDSYVTDLFNQYMKVIAENEYGEQDIDIIEFFDSLQDEIDDSESISVTYSSARFDNSSARLLAFLYT